MAAHAQHDQSLEIFVEYLVEDEDFRDEFLRNPHRTLRHAAEWGLPLSDSEMSALLATDPAVWDRIADDLDSRLQAA